MSRRGLSRVLRCSDCRLKAAAPGFSNQRRTFANSNTCQKHGAVPTFPEVSNPELQGLLSTFRETVFLPAHLSNAHRDLVFGAKHKQVLENDPVVVDVAGEEFRLRHIDRTKDQPSTVKGLLEIIANMKEKGDWNSLPILLEGLKTAGRTVKPQYLEKLVRKAGQAGRQDVIFECSRQVAKTGFVLRDLELVRQIFWWIQHKTLRAGKHMKGSTRALRLAEQMAILMEEERHSGGSIRGNADPRVRPEVIGILLQLAVRTAKTRTSADDDGKVTLYARRLLGSLARGVDLRQGLPTTESWHTRNTLLCYISPLINGMREAIEMLGSRSELATQLKEHETMLSTMAATERELLSKEMPQGATPLGVWCYDELLGSEAT